MKLSACDIGNPAYKSSNEPNMYRCECDVEIFAGPDYSVEKHIEFFYTESAEETNVFVKKPALDFVPSDLFTDLYETIRFNLNPRGRMVLNWIH